MTMTLLQWYAVVEEQYKHISGLSLPLDTPYQAYIAQTYLDGDRTCLEVAETIFTAELLSIFLP